MALYKCIYIYFFLFFHLFIVFVLVNYITSAHHTIVKVHVNATIHEPRVLITIQHLEFPLGQSLPKAVSDQLNYLVQVNS